MESREVYQPWHEGNMAWYIMLRVRAELPQ